MFFAESAHNIQILGVFYLQRSPHTHVSSQRECSYLSLRTRGTSTFTIQGRSEVLHPGDLIYIPQNVDYIQSSEGEEVIAIHLTGSELSSTYEIISLKNYPLFYRLFTQLLQAFTQKRLGYTQHCLSLLYQILYHLTQETAPALNCILLSAYSVSDM